MTFKLKSLAAALVAILAMSAVAASGAQATEGVFEWSPEATKFKTTQDPVEPLQALSTTGGALQSQCNEVHAAGTLPAATTATTLETSQITYNHTEAVNEDSCKLGGVVFHKFQMNGCNYRFHSGETLGAGEITATMDIVCPAGKEIETSGGLLCSLRVPPQTGLKHVIFRNEGTTPETVTGETTVTGLRYTHTGACGDGKAHEDGIYAGKFTTTAENNAGVQKGITVT